MGLHGPRVLEDMDRRLLRTLGNLTMARKLEGFQMDLQALQNDVDMLTKRFGYGEVHYGNRIESGWRLVSLRLCNREVQGEVTTQKAEPSRSSRPAASWHSSAFIRNFLQP